MCKKIINIVSKLTKFVILAFKLKVKVLNFDNFYVETQGLDWKCYCENWHTSFVRTVKLLMTNA